MVPLISCVYCFSFISLSPNLYSFQIKRLDLRLPLPRTGNFFEKKIAFYWENAFQGENSQHAFFRVIFWKRWKTLSLRVENALSQHSKVGWLQLKVVTVTNTPMDYFMVWHIFKIKKQRLLARNPWPIPFDYDFVFCF